MGENTGLAWFPGSRALNVLRGDTALGTKVCTKTTDDSHAPVEKTTSQLVPMVLRSLLEASCLEVGFRRGWASRHDRRHQPKVTTLSQLDVESRRPVDDAWEVFWTGGTRTPFRYFWYSPWHVLGLMAAAGAGSGSRSLPLCSFFFLFIGGFQYQKKWTI